jgi:hypothetical protein
VTEIRKLAGRAEDARLGAASPGGYVRARTGPGGQVLDLRIDPTGLRLTVEELEAEVVAAITAAQCRYAQEISASALGVRTPGQALARLEDGMAKLDALAAELDRTARQHRLVR